jgi:hypothetical protein
MRKTFERLWIIISAAILSVIICGVEFFVYGSYTLICPIIILLTFFFAWWMDIPARSNEATINIVVLEIMEDPVNEDARTKGLRIVKKLVNHDTKGTYGIVEASCLLVLLDNDEVWEYPIIYHSSQNGEGAYFECERNYIITDNQSHIKKIHPQLWKRILGVLKLSDKALLGLMIIVILIIGGLSFAGIIWVFEHFKLWYLLLIVGYVAICSLTEWIYRKLPFKVTNILRYVVSIPFFIVYLLLEIAMPFVTIVGTYFIVAMIAFGVPALILIGLGKTGTLVLRPETIAFIVFSLGSILCSNYHSLTKWIIRHSPLQDCGDHTYESYRQELADYLMHPSNIIFALYLVYFVFLAISGYLQIQDAGYLISEGGDAAVIKAFLVFIAFTNMRSKQKDAKLNVKELLHKTLLLFEQDK